MRPTLRSSLFLLACLLLAATFRLPARSDDKPATPAKDDKTEKPVKDTKTDKPEERQPITFRIEVILRQPKDDMGDANPEKLPPPEEGKKGDTAGRVQRYADLLKSDNLLVRKRAALVLTTLGPDAFPALLELVNQEKDRELKLLVLDKISGRPGGPEAIFSTPQKIEALLKALAGTEPEPGRRQVACQGLAGLYGSRFAAAEQKDKIRTALDEALLDANRDVQAAAAVARELVDRIDARAADPEKANAPRIVRLTLDEALLKALRQQPEDVLKAIRTAFPQAMPKLTEKNVIECRLNEIERVLLLERVRVPEKTGERLKNLAKVEVLAQAKE